MIEKIRLDNFKTFNEIVFDLRQINKHPKNLVGIYGENGSGKSSIIDSVEFLVSSLSTLLTMEKINFVIENQNKLSMRIDDAVKIMVNDSKCSLLQQIIQCKTINSNDELMVIEFFYTLKNGKKVIYTMKFDDTKIVYERLRYQVNKNMVDVFVVTTKSIKFHSSFVRNIKFGRSLFELKDSLFGLHTFMAILNYQYSKFNLSYMKQVLDPYIYEILKEFAGIKVLSKSDETRIFNYIRNNSGRLSLASGEILNTPEEIDKLKSNEHLLNSFFVALYSDIKSMKYILTPDRQYIRYELFVNKLVGGKIISIPFSYESTGTIKLLDILPYICDYVSGSVVLIDEIDSGIHDLLMVELIKLIQETSGGQLIFTSHNTLLLSELEPEQIYIIDSSYNGQKTVECISSCERVQKNHNLTKRYLNGVYAGVPIPGYLDLEELANGVR